MGNYKIEENCPNKLNNWENYLKYPEEKHDYHQNQNDNKFFKSAVHLIFLFSCGCLGLFIILCWYSKMNK
jgi:hypothetical protein